MFLHRLISDGRRPGKALVFYSQQIVVADPRAGLTAGSAGRGHVDRYECAGLDMSSGDGVDARQLLRVSTALKEIYPSAWRTWGEVLRSMDVAEEDDQVPHPGDRQ